MSNRLRTTPFQRPATTRLAEMDRNQLLHAASIMCRLLHKHGIATDFTLERRDDYKRREAARREATK